MALKTLPQADALIVPRRHRITVSEFERMIAANVWPEDERIELIEGELIAMSPINAPHAAALTALTEIFLQPLQGRAVVWSQNPVRLDDDTRPQPDLALLRPPASRYRAQLPGPADVFLLIEISDTTLTYDRDRKLPLYAKAGIPETWLVDVNGEQVFAYRQPENGVYTQLTTYKRGAVISPEAFPDVTVRVDDILGESDAAA